MFRKMAVLGAMVLVAMVAAQPAEAGVGGCGPRIGVGGCWQLTVSDAPTGFIPMVLDSIRGAVPADVVAAMKALYDGKKIRTQLQQPGDTTTQGVGGCRPIPGVGGCWL